MTAFWQPIPHTAGLHETAVLLKYNTSRDKLSVHVTDLSQVWSEELSKADICDRARSTNSSIDPSEDDSQLDILLEKIHSALRGDEGTTIAVVADGPDHLAVTLTIPLPDPLPVLTWPLRLGPGSREQVKTEVMVPLVCSTYMRKQQQDDLCSLLLAKDNIINRMANKIEEVGLDLVTLFPQLGKLKQKRNQRELLAQHVRGLGPFEEAAWRRQFGATVHDGLAFRDMSTVAFQESGTEAVEGLLKGLDQEVFRPLPELLRTGLTPKTKLKRAETKEEFQHQITPQKLKDRRARAERFRETPNGETTDGDRTASPTPNPRSVGSSFRDESPTRRAPTSARRLGQIGGGRKQGRQQSPTKSTDEVKGVRESPQTEKDTSVDDEGYQVQKAPRRKTSLTPEDAEPPELSPSKRARQTSVEDNTKPAPAPRRLGRIGRKATPVNEPPPEAVTKSSTEPEDAAPASTDPLASQPALPRTPRKLGHIGGRRNSTQAASQAASQAHSQRPELETVKEQDQPVESQGGNVAGREASARLRTQSPPTESQPAESPEDKANRRRRELEREMSQQEKTPKKKRRRF